MRLIKQSTSIDTVIGPFLDEADGKTAETTLTITQADIRLKKNGGNWAQKNAAQTLSHEENGNYEVTLDTTDTDTLGQLRVHVHESGALPVWEDFMVMPANVWDSLFGSDKLEVDVAQFGGTNLTASGGRPEVNTTLIEGSDATDQIRDAVVDDATRIDASALNTLSGHDPGETIMGATDTVVLTDGSLTAAKIAANAITAAKLDPDVTTELQAGLATAAALATVDGIVDDILLDTAEIGAAGAGLTNINLPNQTMDIVGNITGNLSGSVGSVSGAVGSVTGNVGGNVTGTVGGFTTAAKAEIQTEAEDALVAHRLDELLNADSDIDGAAPPTVGSVIHEMLTKTAGSFTYDQTTDSLEAVRDRGDAAWTTATGFSTLSQADVRTAVGLASNNLDTQLADLPTNAELATALAAADDAVLAAIAALNNLSAAQVNAEVVDALATDTYAEPAAVPAATASLKDKIAFLAVLARNKVTQTATTQTLRNDADSGNIGTASVSDDGTTFTRAEWQ